MGFRSLVGTDLAGAFDRISSLQLGLGRWRDGDREQAAAVYHALPSHRQTLEGLLAFGQIAMEEADRLDLRDAESLGRLHHSVTTARDSIAALLTLLDRIGG